MPGPRSRGGSVGRPSRGGGGEGPRSGSRTGGGVVSGGGRRIPSRPCSARGVGAQACGGPPAGDGGQGVGSETAAPKMSELPKVAGQSACGAGLVTDVPVRRDSRQASRAGQSALLRTSFQTPTAPVRVAAVYT